LDDRQGLVPKCFILADFFAALAHLAAKMHASVITQTGGGGDF
jgi:hypothetical protein